MEHAVTITPLPADTVVSRFGVNGHLNWPSWSGTEWRQPLADLGARNLRTMIARINAGRDNLAWWHTATQGRGKAIVLVSPYKKTASLSPVFDQALIKSYIDYARDQVGPAKILAIEGPNEPNDDKAGDWVKAIRDHQAWLFATVNADPLLANIPVVGPSVFRRIPADYTALGDMSGMVDIGNLHYYTAGTKPTIGHRDNGTAPMNTVIADAQACFPNRPMWATEYGHNCRDDPRKTNWFLITPIAAAKYGLRGHFEFLKRNFGMIAWFTLFDDYEHNAEQFGLMGKTASTPLKARPAYGAFQRLLALFNDPVGTVALTPLNLTFTGNMTDVGHMLFRKSDGKYLLAIWQDAASYNQTTKKDAVIQPRAISLTFGAVVQSVRTFTPTTSAAAIQVGSNTSSVVLQVPDHVMVAEIVL